MCRSECEGSSRAEEAGFGGRFAGKVCISSVFPPLLGPGSTEDFFMDAESRIAIVSMIVEDTEMSAEINRILHEIGRAHV